MFDKEISEKRSHDHQHHHHLDPEFNPAESEQISRADAIETDFEKRLEAEIEKSLSREDAGLRDSRISSSQATQSSVNDETAPLSRDASRKEDLEAARTAMRPGEGFPDGGLQAWKCVMGGWLILFCALGFMNTIGVFQAYYKAELLPQYTPSALSWINGSQLFLLYAGGSVAGPLFDVYGPKWILRGGAVFMTFGIMMLSLSTEYYQVFLSQGVLVALASAFSFYPSINAVATWFFHRRALAIGLTTTGGSVGGVVFPILMSKCLPKLGFGWSLRLIGFIMLLFLSIATLLVRSRLEHPKSFKGKRVILLDFEAFKTPAWSYFTLGCFIQLLGLWAPINYFASYALTKGFSASMAFNLLAILNAGSFFGRSVPGLIADKMGRITCFGIFSCLSGVLIVAGWLNLTNHASVIAFIALYGATSGAFLSMYPACVAQLSPIEKIGLRLGTLNSVTGISSLVALPLNGALVRGDNYTPLIVFAGVMMIAGAFFMGIARYYAGGKKLKVIV